VHYGTAAGKAHDGSRYACTSAIPAGGWLLLPGDAVSNSGLDPCRVEGPRFTIEQSQLRACNRASHQRAHNAGTKPLAPNNNCETSGP